MLVRCRTLHSIPCRNPSNIIRLAAFTTMLWLLKSFPLPLFFLTIFKIHPPPPLSEDFSEKRRNKCMRLKIIAKCVTEKRKFYFLLVITTPSWKAWDLVNVTIFSTEISLRIFPFYSNLKLINYEYLKSLYIGIYIYIFFSFPNKTESFIMPWGYLRWKIRCLDNAPHPRHHRGRRCVPLGLYSRTSTSSAKRCSPLKRQSSIKANGLREGNLPLWTPSDPAPAPFSRLSRIPSLRSDPSNVFSLFVINC